MSRNQHQDSATTHEGIILENRVACAEFDRRMTTSAPSRSTRQDYQAAVDCKELGDRVADALREQNR
ncbi:hypothetical protein [Nonomuraea rhodomycinica]|uniref:Uncharacterized protein n=1 Tax=Nonomuraea rhodomycinica TaxID=1712872 RepID=A0A7Y6IZ03_9ACTN|nr:hypothetical protein [Nonomuraea rhodomycinica]NUW47021.1 hypothetical protein [Nonomuraea rhodomycinica]